MLIAVLLLDIVLLVEMVVAAVVVFATSPMDVKWYWPPRIELSKHKEILQIALFIIQEQLKYNNSKLH